MDWKRIKSEYIAGGTSYRKLCEKYGVSRTTLQRKAKDEKWVDLRCQTEAKTEAKIVEAVSEINAEIDTKYFDLVDKLFDKAKEVIELTPEWNVVTLKEMASAMKYLKECKGVKSDADMREQEARIAKLRKEAQDDDNSSKDITVIIGSDAEEYSE